MSSSNNTVLLKTKIVLSYLQPKQTAIKIKYGVVCNVCLTLLFIAASILTGIVS
jgi:hypothetical protein